MNQEDCTCRHPWRTFFMHHWAEIDVIVILCTTLVLVVGFVCYAGYSIYKLNFCATHDILMYPNCN